MKPFHLVIRTSEGVVFEGSGDSLVLPGTHGRLGVLADHAPMVGMTVPGTAVLQQDGTTRRFFVGSGLFEIGGNRVSVLVDTARPVETPADAEDELDKYTVWQKESALIEEMLRG